MRTTTSFIHANFILIKSKENGLYLFSLSANFLLQTRFFKVWFLSTIGPRYNRKTYTRRQFEALFAFFKQACRTFKKKKKKSYNRENDRKLLPRANMFVYSLDPIRVGCVRKANDFFLIDTVRFNALIFGQTFNNPRMLVRSSRSPASDRSRSIKSRLTSSHFQSLVSTIFEAC